MPRPRRNHQTASLLRWNKACAETKGTPLSLRMLADRPRSKKPLKYRESVVLSSGRESLPGEQKSADVISNGQRVAIVLVAEQEPPL